MTVVLDSWAVLRYLEDGGSAADDVAQLLATERPLISWINLGEGDAMMLPCAPP